MPSTSTEPSTTAPAPTVAPYADDLYQKARPTLAFSKKEVQKLDDYQRFVVRRIADGVRRAVKNLAPAQIGWAVGRHDKNIADKMTHWFEVIGEVLRDPTVRPENVYKMDDTGVMPSMLGSVKTLVGKDDKRDYRGARVK